MSDIMSRRGFGMLAVAAVSLAFTGPGFAGQATGKRQHKPLRMRMYYRNAGGRKKITTGACIPGEPDYDPDQCYEDIKD